MNVAQSMVGVSGTIQGSLWDAMSAQGVPPDGPSTTRPDLRSVTYSGNGAAFCFDETVTALGDGLVQGL